MHTHIYMYTYFILHPQTPPTVLHPPPSNPAHCTSSSTLKPRPLYFILHPQTPPTVLHPPPSTPAHCTSFSTLKPRPLPHPLLPGHQLRSQSLSEMYVQTLLKGCRCLELDCWPTGGGEAEDICITHGGTLCTKVSFKVRGGGEGEGRR